ncbi:MAG: hypothetical protein LBI82_08380 [Dysgonamonadaceae bacterium]|jgi:translation initiation factor 2 gamma subunit (eIF-2gamma)|nr:hypothetical protein [Dysgonamonadaceae bacterium]
MKKYIIRISKPAETDIDSIIDYIENEYYAPQTAEKFYNNLILLKYFGHNSINKAWHENQNSKEK